MNKQTKQPGELVREIRQYLGANVHLASVDGAALDDVALQLARSVLGDQRRGEPVAYRAWDDHNSRWTFTLWPAEIDIGPVWEPLFTAPHPAELATCNPSLQPTEPCPHCASVDGKPGPRVQEAWHAGWEAARDAGQGATDQHAPVRAAPGG